MKQELKAKVLDALKGLEPNDIVQENVYKCANDGMVCFNGFIAEIANPDKYDLDSAWQYALDRAYEAQDEYLLEEVRHDLASWEHWDDISPEEQTRLIDSVFERSRDTVESPDVERSEVEDIMGDEISEDLNAYVYDTVVTQQEINELHYDWINHKIDFDLAMAELERIIRSYE